MNHFLAFSIFATVFLGTTCLNYFYLKYRLLKTLNYSESTKKYLNYVLAFILFSPILAIPIRFFDSVNFYFWIAYVSLGTSSFLFTFTLLRDIVLVLIKLYHRFKLTQKEKSKSSSKILDRKSFISEAFGKGIFFTSALFTGYGVHQARKTAERVKVEVPIENLPKEFDGFKITQATDIHIGLTIKRAYIEGIVETMNETSPDIVAITGDLVDGPVKQLYHHAEPLQELQSRFGNYFVTGNHEYYSGAIEWIKAVKKLGLIPLINEHTVIKKKTANLILAGVTDYTAHRILPEHKTDPRVAITGCPAEGCKILLAHQPRSIFEAAECGYDLQISGHTHGGQFFPWNFIVQLVQPYTKGLHQHKKTWIYVSKGTGYWGPPVRVGVPSEITEIILRKA